MDPPPLRLGALARVTRFGITEVNPIEGPAEHGADSSGGGPFYSLAELQFVAPVCGG